MRKLFLTFVMALLCNVVSFAQFAGGNGTAGNPYLISTKAQFEAIAQQSNGASGKYFKQTADINLGVYENRTSSIIPTFRGTYDGDGHTITYQASFKGTSNDGNYALFGKVEGGTLENINVNADVTISGTANDMQVALLCGKFTNQTETSSGSEPTTYSYSYSYDGIIINCNVNGNINSTVSAEKGGGTDAGLLVGESQGQIKYCNANGNVRGLGYVGGLIGQMSGQYRERHQEQQWSWETFSRQWQDVYTDYTYPEGSVSVIGSSFIGTVTADSPSKDWDMDQYGSFAGGICGFANTNTEITLCYVSASINLGNHNAGINNEESGIASTAINGSGSPTVTNNYAEGTINGVPMENVACGGITNSAGNTSYNYYPGGSSTNEGEGDCITDEMDSEEIAEALNNAANAAGESENIHFSPVGDGNVIFGQVSKVCEAPTNLTITNNEGTYTATWTSANADNTITEATWHWSLTGGNAHEAGGDPTSGSSPVSVNLGTLPASPNPYTFTVYTDCSAFNTENSQSVSSTFTVACPTPTGLTASNITDNGFKISWTANVDCQLTVNGNNYVISAGNPMEKTITGLNPETTYNIIVKAKCGGEYVEQATTNVTTARLAAPTGLTVTPTWQSTSGKIVVNWNIVAGLIYEYEIEKEGEAEPEAGNTVSVFEKTELDEGAYTLKLRAKKGDKYSDWVSMPYTISSPDAPKNPQVGYTINENGNSYDVTVSWTAGSTPNNGWIVNGGEVQNTASYVLTAQTPGSNTTLSIVEKVDLSFSGALQVPIQVPCLPATLPNAVSTTQTSATFTFSQAIEGRKVIIGINEYPASETSITIDGLTSGTTYSYEVREYCNETQYSSDIANFATVGCFAVKNLSVSDIGVTNATISWGSQSTLAGLNYQITVDGETKPEQTATTITLTGLTSATEYTVVVKEQCGEGWGEERTITFTTESGNYVTAKDGDFDFPDTWEGNRVPTGNFGNITIKHNVTLSHSLTLSGSCRISNEGVLKITSQGELINTTGNNVGGIIEVETPQKDMNKWTFIGAPFESGYKLGSIKPVSGSDVAMVEYNYTDGEWSNYFVNYETTMSAAEGAFAWMFYNGVVTFSTYDLGRNGTSYPADADADYALNNTDVTVTETLRNSVSSPGYWMALANPYPAKLSISDFLGDNNTLQGVCVYDFTYGSFDIKTTGDINMTEGFFVNFGSAGSHTANFNKEQLTNYPSSSSKSTNASYEFIELTLQNGKDKVRVYFAHNEDAEQGYDILDANKMFATTGVAEPYFVTEGIPLIKEEVRDLPYYATMNVRSQEDTVMNFVLTNLPEGYAVSIIDGEEVIDLVEGGVYSTEIASGENADRFKVLVKKNVGLADVEELDVRITNSNRHITITAQENVRTEVYNTLGQKVFETEETNFVLSGVASGAYVVKVQGAKASKSQKIVVE